MNTVHWLPLLKIVWNILLFQFKFYFLCLMGWSNSICSSKWMTVSLWIRHNLSSKTNCLKQLICFDMSPSYEELVIKQLSSGFRSDIQLSVLSVSTKCFIFWVDSNLLQNLIGIVWSVLCTSNMNLDGNAIYKCHENEFWKNIIW